MGTTLLQFLEQKEKYQSSRRDWILPKSANYHQIFYKVPRLFRPETLPELREDMELAISSLSAGSRNLLGHVH